MEQLEVATVEGGTRFRHHAHDGVHVAVVLQGGFAEREGTTWREVTPGEVRVSAAASHDIDFAPSGARCLVLEADAPLGGSVLASLARPRFVTTDRWLATLIAALDRHALRDDADAALRRSGLQVELFAQLERRVDGRLAPPPPWLVRVRELLHDIGGRVSVHQLAALAGVHRVHLARAFRDHFGVPVTVYARRLQLADAERLIRTTALPLSQVAALAGFADQSHLTRAMRAVLGHTPGSVRRPALHLFKTRRGAPR